MDGMRLMAGWDGWDESDGWMDGMGWMYEIDGWMDGMRWDGWDVMGWD